MRILIIILSVYFISCRQRAADPGSPAETDSIENSMNLSPEFHGAVLWHVDFETKTKRKDSTFKNEYLNADSLIKALNLLYQNIKLEKVKISGDTLFTVIKNNEYLGERMGTTGSELYVAEVVINLTSVNGINYVRIDMDERSHASPGVWKFSDFSDFKVVPW